jgi:DNA polymerase III subunit epsilon
MRQIVLDTETTGLDPAQGHRLIEIGCVELINRLPTGNNFHYYINPQRDIDEGAQAVHGITSEFLQDKSLFADIEAELLAYLTDAELVIHNAPFDVGFLNHEYRLLDDSFPTIEQLCTIIDTLVMARKRHPGQKNNLDALCKRYHVNNSNRQLHGALLDAQILADVYLMMTGGQTTMFTAEQNAKQATAVRMAAKRKHDPARASLPIVYANATELAAHDVFMQQISEAQE